MRRPEVAGAEANDEWLHLEPKITKIERRSICHWMEMENESIKKLGILYHFRPTRHTIKKGGGGIGS
jgi:hypothetical protein